ncbi:hypothetical protein [Dyella sp.]|uniref:hypothetical protein n=1 Tax=Dyella sp. TaxID=1869338 RepID=UPI00283EBAC7|nr:hypothetical protein [Dyella sp.]MDR3444693.1 hypothetical protein [Dyella sp.]
MIVTTRDLFTIPGYSKRCGFCRSGARHWFATHHLDWTHFVKHGIDAQILEATGDALALALVAWARKRAEQSNG